MSRESRIKIKSARRRNRSKPLHALRPRLVVHRSLKNISAQIIDDIKGETLVSASSKDKDLQKDIAKSSSKMDKSKLVGAALGKKASKAKISKVVLTGMDIPITDE